MRTVIVDADTLVYQAATRAETSVEFEKDLWVLWADFGEARAILDDLVQEIIDSLDASQIVMALSDYEEPNWRLSVMPSYKQQRKLVRRPTVWKPLREYIEQTYRTYRRPTLEGDDVVGILLTHPHLIEGEKIAVSLDKDMNTLPGLHVNYAKDGLKDVTPRIVTEWEADSFHMLQTLMGDRVDGYDGVPGIGPVKARRLLDGTTNHEEMWEVVVGAYENAGLSEEVALMNARVARICRATDYDFTNKRVRLWEPPRRTP